MSGDSTHMQTAGGWRSGPFGRLLETLRRWDSRGQLTLLGLLLVIIVGVGGSLYGAFLADPDIRVRQLDAGPVERFAIGEVVAYPDDNVYLVGLEDGRIRAVDGIVKASGCVVEWLPTEARTASGNPQGMPGGYRDPCSGAVWHTSGNAFSGTSEPLRTFQIDYETNDEGVQHVWVEVLGKRDGQP